MKAARDLMHSAVKDGVFPGGMLLVATRDRVEFFGVFGLARLEPERPMTTRTVFDLASLTKPLATTVAIMVLVQDGRLNPDQTLGSVIPDFSGTDKAVITVRQLLSHTSGLPDYRPYYKELIKLQPSGRKGSLRGLLLTERLIHAPGQACLYSDVGFMVLEWVVEVAAKKPLDRFVEETVYGPLRLKDLFFIHLNGGKGGAKAQGARKTAERRHPAISIGANSMPAKGIGCRTEAVVLAPEAELLQARVHRSYAATEDCPWRGKILDGEVHDDNAYVMGGVAGHAGLFGTAHDVYSLLKELLDVYEGKPNSGIFRQDVVQTFFQRQSDVGSWALGFDTPTQPDSSSGRYFSDQSVGHLGFTGTSFWVDLRKRITVVLLTNRIHPSRQDERIKAFRPILHDTIMDAIRKSGENLGATHSTPATNFHLFK